MSTMFTISKSLPTCAFSTILPGTTFMVIDAINGNCVDFLRIEDTENEFGMILNAVQLDNGKTWEFKNTDRVHLYE